MRQFPVSPQATVRLDASGNGQVSLTPPSGTKWDLQLAAVSVVSPSGVTVLIPQLSLYLGSSAGPLTLIDSTYLGSSASSGKVKGTPVYSGTCIWAVWKGADPNALASLQLYGTQSTGYRGASR